MTWLIGSFSLIALISDEDAARSNTDNAPRISFTLQGAMATSDHSHFHHHAFRHRPEQEDGPLRFRDSRANEQAEKLRDKLRERQLSGAAQNVPDTILVPCQVSVTNTSTTHLTSLI